MGNIVRVRAENYRLYCLYSRCIVDSDRAGYFPLCFWPTSATTYVDKYWITATISSVA